MKRWICTAAAAVLLAGCAGPYRNIKPMEFSELRYPFAVKYVQVNKDIRLAYVEEGAGSETLLFLHGLGSYLPAWSRNLPELRKHFRCIAVDLPGYGKSSKGLYPFTMSFYADVLAQFLDRLGIEQVTPVGHSMGGQIALVMALRHPQKVRRLVLIDPAGFETFSDGERRWFEEVMTVDFVKKTPVQQIRANVVNNFYNLPREAEFMITDRIALRHARDFEKYCYTVVHSVHGMLEEPVIDRLGEIRQPALIIFGEQDNLIPNPILHGGRAREIAEIGRQRLPNSRLVMIPQCGHFAQFEKPREVNRAIVQFFAGK